MLHAFAGLCLLVIAAAIILPREIRMPAANQNKPFKFSKQRPSSAGTISHPAARMRSSCAKTMCPRKTEGAGKAGCSPHPQPRMRNEISIRA
jgi:hypothetical protein